MKPLKPAAAAVAALLAGCAVGPDFHRPAPPEAASLTAHPLPDQTSSAAVAGGTAQSLKTGADIPGLWWELFRSPKLDALMQEAIARNPDLASARAALRQSQELYKAQRGALFPSVEADFTNTRAKNSNALSPVLSTPNQLYSLHTAQLAISYTADVFGGVRRQVENARATAEAQRFELEAAYLTLASNLASAAVQEASLRAQIAATQRTIEAERDLRDLDVKQLTAGQISGADVAAQEALLAQTEATLPPLRKQLAQQDDLISVLTGHLPGEGVRAEFELDDLVLPEDLPLSLPSKLVEQRPDVRAAEFNLHAASANVGGHRRALAQHHPEPRDGRRLDPALHPVLGRQPVLDPDRRGRAADLPGRGLDAQAEGGAGRARPGAGAIPLDGAHRLPGRRRHAGGRASRRRRPEGRAGR